MSPEEVQEIIESNIPDATADIGQPRGVDDDDHLAATVVSTAFEGKSLVDQHDMVYEALDDHMTTDIHAVELTTRTPEE